MRMYKLLSIDPGFRPAFEFLVSTYYQKKDRDSLEKLLREWITNNPTDDHSTALLAQITKSGFVFPKE